jgi:mevalonate kinase
MNQAMLVAIGVSHPTLQAVCDESASLGFSAKLTGAGGGGCAITVLGIGSAYGNSSAGSFVSMEAVAADALHTQAVVQLKNRLR